MAEELVQDTFVRLWRGADRFDPARGSARTWIYAIARNSAIDLQRRRSARPLDLDDPGPEVFGTEEPHEHLVDKLEVRAALEDHLAGCAACAVEARELGGVSERLDVMAAPEPAPASLRLRVLAAVEEVAMGSNGRAVGHDVRTEPAGAPVAEPPPRLDAQPTPVPSEHRESARRWSPWPRRLAFGGAVATIAAAAVIVAGPFGSSAAPVEIEGQLTGDSTADIVVSRLGSGREVELTSSEFPILPKGEAYEVWFVGAGDSADDPNRVSAGTLHPDEAGNTDVVLHAAVDPALYPLIEITAEPAGGNPALEGKVVAELDAAGQLP